MVTEGLSDRLSEDTLASELSEKFEPPGDVREDIARYFRGPEGHLGHTYSYARDAAHRRLSRRLEKKSRDDQARGWATRPKDHGLSAALALGSSASAVRGAGKGCNRRLMERVLFKTQNQNTKPT